ncbi:MAG: type IV pilus assembly protein PilM [Candidatus Sungbacteria bacterium]|nr:type IV pilus assembly protein PilM [Candidatus Sungbacteria bacterium]
MGLSFNAMAFDFLKKIGLPRISIPGFSGSKSIVGIDIGVSSVKVVQLRKESERGILETYGELKTAPYLKTGEGGVGGGFLRFLDSDISGLLKDVMRESNITTNKAVVAIPAISSFVTLVQLPTTDRAEVAKAVEFEARKYVPIPISEVSLDWQIIDEGDLAPADAANKTKVLLVAVPKEVVAKYNRVFEEAKLVIKGLEVETFSLVRSLIGHDKSPTALINIGSQSTTIAIVDRGVVMLSHNLDRGSNDLTSALSRGLGITLERANAFKQEIGLSDHPEDKEIASVISPLVEILLSELERIINSYNRTTERRVEKVYLTGGGSRLKGFVDQTAKRLGLETIQPNPFSRVTYPAFMQPILKDLGPTFPVAVGLALREITPH